MSKERENREIQFYTSHRNIKKRNVCIHFYMQEAFERSISRFAHSILHILFLFCFFNPYMSKLYKHQYGQSSVSSIFTWILPQSWAHLFPTENESLLSLRSLYCEYCFLFAVRSILLNIRLIRSLNRLILCSCV